MDSPHGCGGGAPRPPAGIEKSLVMYKTSLTAVTSSSPRVGWELYTASVVGTRVPGGDSRAPRSDLIARGERS